MASGRIVLQPAFVLHRTPFRETSLLIEAFSKDFGRVGLVARGARRGKSRALLQPFQPLLLSWSGRGELLSLSGSESGGVAMPLLGRAVISGFYLNELLLRLLYRHDPHPELFQIYHSSLARLVQHEAQALRRFEKGLLDAIGYGLNLTEESRYGADILPERRYCYHLQHGPLPCSESLPGAIPVHGDTLLALAAEEELTPRALREAKSLLRAALAVHLGDKPLESRALYRQALAAPRGIPDEQ